MDFQPEGGSMSEELWFSDNYSDISRQSGMDAGFEFEFRCQRCSQTWRSGFTPYKLAKASGWLHQATELASSRLGYDASNAAQSLSDAGWSRGRDAAFKKAIQEASTHFHRCAKCTNQVCGQCWNAQAGLCLNCAPDLASNVESARAQGLVESAVQSAHSYGGEQAAQVDVTTTHQLSCPQCRAETHGAKFCPECGHRLDVAVNCPSCSAQIPPGARFCGECGTHVG
jgi:hypothetical protein